jgi:hypothetical protein
MASSPALTLFRVTQRGVAGAGRSDQITRRDDGRGARDFYPPDAIKIVVTVN